MNREHNEDSKTLWFEFLLCPNLLEEHLQRKKCDPSPVELIVTFLNNASLNGTSREWNNSMGLNVPVTIPLTPTSSPSSSATNSNGNKNGTLSADDISPPLCNGLPNQSVLLGTTNNNCSTNSNHLINGGLKDTVATNDDFNLKKAERLKLLAIKVGTFMEWNLEFLEDQLPITMQFTLLKELIQIMELAKAPLQMIKFAYITYFRWILRSIMRLSYPIRGPRGLAMPPQLLQQINPTYVPMEVLESMFKKLRDLSQKAVNNLETFLTERDLTVIRPLINCFPEKFHSDNQIKCNWSEAKNLDSHQLIDTLNYELGKWYFFNENYKIAFKYFNAIDKDRGLSYSNFKEYLQASESMSNEGCVVDSETTSFKASFDECLTEVKRGASCDLSFVERTVDLEIVSEQLNACYKKSKDPDERRNIQRFAFYLISKVNGLKKLIPSITSDLTSSATESNCDLSSSNFVEEGEIEIEEEGEQDPELTLLEATDPSEIQNLVNKVNRPPLLINRNWDIPRAHAACLKNLPISQYNKCHIVLAKAAELRRAKMFSESRILYLSLLEDFQASLPNLAEIITFELLQTDLQHHVESNDIDERRICELLAKCERTVMNDKLLADLPPDLVDLCCLFLLDSGKHVLMDLINSKYPCLRLSAIISHLSNVDSNLHSIPKSEELLWDHVLAVLSNTGSRVAVSKNMRNPPPPLPPYWNIEAFGKFVLKLKKSSHISLLISCLIQIFNLKRDASGIELTLLPQPAISWSNFLPSHATNISLSKLSDLLKKLIERGLSLQPNEISLIRCKAELALIEEMYADAMKNYITLMIITTEYFTAFGTYPEEDKVIQRMIHCSTKLVCHTQAALLHQMTKEPNYTLIFKSLGERVCNDSCDDLYDCFWDITILEYLVNLHTRRGEIDRKNKSLQMIGQLELNANNSPDILSQAANVRKSKFFRQLAKRYL